MRPLGFPLLADENVHPQVIAGLRAAGCDVESVLESGLGGTDDLGVVRHAFASGRVILTHDSDFGTLAVRAAEPIVGGIHLRPGHIRPEVVLGTLDALATLQLDATAPFLLVAHRHGETLRVRLRQLPPP